MLIHVTQEMIAAGEIGDCKTCPIALALKAEGFVDITVDGNCVDFYTPDGKWSGVLVLPAAAREFVKAFDDEEFVAPIEFEMPDLTPGVIPVTAASRPIVE
jgi:hypothetical protein